MMVAFHAITILALKLNEISLTNVQTSNLKLVKTKDDIKKSKGSSDCASANWSWDIYIYTHHHMYICHQGFANLSLPFAMHAARLCTVREIYVQVRLVLTLPHMVAYLFFRQRC